MQRSDSLLVHDVDISAGLEEQADNIHIVQLNSDVKWCPINCILRDSAVVNNSRVGICAEEEFNNFDVLCLDRDVERCEIIIVENICFCAEFEQKSSTSSCFRCYCIMEWCFSFRILCLCKNLYVFLR